MINQGCEDGRSIGSSSQNPKSSIRYKLVRPVRCVDMFVLTPGPESGSWWCFQDGVRPACGHPLIQGLGLCWRPCHGSVCVRVLGRLCPHAPKGWFWICSGRSSLLRCFEPDPFIFWIMWGRTGSPSCVGLIPHVTDLWKNTVDFEEVYHKNMWKSQVLCDFWEKPVAPGAGGGFMGWSPCFPTLEVSASFVFSGSILKRATRQ